MASRIPQKDSEFLSYINGTTLQLAKQFKPEILKSVAALTTVNLVTGDFTGNLKLTFANTGAVGSPDLYFCIAAEDDEACDTDILAVAAGAEAQRAIKQLGTAGNRSLNVTNVHATDASLCKVIFPLNWDRLGLLEEVFITWKNFRDSWVEKYLLTQDDSKRTATLTQEKNNIKKDFTAFAEAPLKLIEGSPNIVQEDRDIFNLPKPDRTPTARAAITTAPFSDLKGQDGARVLFTHRRESDASRTGIHPDSDGVETRWVLLEMSATPPATPPAPPASPAECPNVEFSSKAVHTLSLGVENAGKRLHSFSRWRNNSEPQKSGPFGQRMTIVVND